VRPQKTKIVCTIGPATRSAATIRALVRAGMDVARLNFSHGTPDEHAEVLERVRAASKRFGVPVAVLQDLSGPKVRLGEVRDGACVLRPRRTVVLTVENVVGDEQCLSVSYKQLAAEVRPRQPILINDGAVRLSVVETDGTRVTCRVVTGGTVSSRKGVNLPRTTLSVGSLTTKDRADAAWGLEHDVDFFALSFVRSADDVKALRSIITKADKATPIIAKIEKREALRNLDEILRVADGVMVARGDLGVEINLADIPAAQKRIIAACNRAGKPVITATQMLESMVTNARPTRAEVTDVANAILDGTDAVMLSEETATGRYPVDAVKFMALIAWATERSFPHEAFLPPNPYQRGEIADSMSHAACRLAEDLGVAAIITPTRTGRTARLVSRYRPRSPILAFSPKSTTVRRLVLSWGVYPILVTEFTNVDEIVGKGITAALQRGWVAKGQRVVVTAGTPVDLPGTTNLITVEEL